MRELITAVVITVGLGFVGYLFLLGVNLSDFITQLAVGILLALIVVGYWGFKPRIDALIARREIDSQILNEYKQKYHVHVKELFNVVIQNLDQPNSTNYFGAIRKIHNEKKLLFEHFCTTTLVHHEYSNLYVWYKTILTSHNDLEEESKALYSLIKGCESEIEAFGFERPPSENWIQIMDFEDAVGIRVPSLQDVLKSVARPISGHIQYDFDIIYDNSVAEWRIGSENNQFGGSKSHKKINQLSNCIKKYGEEIAKKSSNISSTETLLKRTVEPAFNREFNDLYQTIKHGEPKVGACDSCIEWFGGKEQAKLKNILDNMHKDHEFLEESLWTTKEK